MIEPFLSLLTKVAEEILKIIINDLTRQPHLANLRHKLQGDPPEKQALQRALYSAFDKFDRLHRDLTQSFFDDAYLLKPEVAFQLSRFLTPNQDPDPSILISLWQKQFHSPPQYDLLPPLKEFLADFHSAIKTEPDLKPYYDSRALEQLYQIAAKLDEQTEIQQQILDALRQPSPAPSRLPTYNPPPLPPLDLPPEPGPQLPGWRLDLPRNQIFTGRTVDILALASGLISSSAIAITQAISGMGGIGKTQLAVEFCYRYGRFFHGVHWLYADQDLPSQIADCGRRMGLSFVSDAIQDQANQTLDFWRAGGSRLVVLDNLESTDILQQWIHQFGPACLLITSRISDWPPDLGLQIHCLDTLLRSESIAFLLKLAPHLSSFPEDDISSLADYLGDLPLALDLAGRFLHENDQLSIQAYLSDLSAYEEIFLQHPSLTDWTNHSPTHHVTSLFATFLTSWEKIKDPFQRSIFFLCGFCSPNTPIPASILLCAVADEKNPSQLKRALKPLYDFGLLKKSPGGPVIHPLLALFSRYRSEHEQCNIIGTSFHRLIRLGAQSGKSHLISRIQPLLAHFKSFADFLRDNNPESGYFYLAYGTLLFLVGNYLAAKNALETACRLDEQQIGEDDPDRAVSIFFLGAVLMKQGDYAGARQRVEQAVDLMQRTLGPDHPDLGISLANLGRVLLKQGDYPVARQRLEQAVDLMQRTLGPDHPDLGYPLSDQGEVLMKQGDYPAARQRLEQAVDLMQRTLGPLHDDVRYVNRLLQEINFRKSGPNDTLLNKKNSLEYELNNSRNLYGESHPKTIESLFELGFYLWNMGDFPAARSYLEQALSKNIKNFGKNHPDTIKFLYYLGDLLKQLGDRRAARRYFEQALSIQDELGEQSYFTHLVRKELDSFLWNWNNPHLSQKPSKSILDTDPTKQNIPGDLPCPDGDRGLFAQDNSSSTEIGNQQESWLQDWSKPHPSFAENDGHSTTSSPSFPNESSSSSPIDESHHTQKETDIEHGESGSSKSTDLTK